MTFTVVVDTREQLPYDFAGIPNVTEYALNVGDYTYEGFEDTFSVERKTVEDLAQSLGSDRDRFEAEIQRAQNLEEFAVVIEDDRSSVEWFSDYLASEDLKIGEAKNKALNGEPPRLPYLVETHPNSVLGTVDKWPDKYETLDFYWCGSREEAKQQTLWLLDKWYLRYREE